MVEKDPVCGMPVDTKRAGSSLSLSYNGRTYYFCSHYCREHFEADPERYYRERQTGMIGPHKEFREKGGENE